VPSFCDLLTEQARACRALMALEAAE